jgi:hypothetical protein
VAELLPAAEPIFVVQESIPSLAKSIPGLHKRVQIRALSRVRSSVFKTSAHLEFWIKKLKLIDVRTRGWAMGWINKYFLLPFADKRAGSPVSMYE